MKKCHSEVAHIYNVKTRNAVKMSLMLCNIWSENFFYSLHYMAILQIHKLNLSVGQLFPNEASKVLVTKESYLVSPQFQSQCYG